MHLPCLEKSVTLTVDKINIREDLNFHLRFALNILSYSSTAQVRTKIILSFLAQN